MSMGLGQMFGVGDDHNKPPPWMTTGPVGGAAPPGAVVTRPVSYGGGSGAVPGTTSPANIGGGQEAGSAGQVATAQPQTGGGTPGNAQPPVGGSAPAAPTQGLTFAQMQQQGMARPAPPAPAPVPQVPVGAASGGGSPMRAQIAAGLQQILNKPSSYDDAAMMAELTKGARGIDDQFTQANRNLDEEMARRGIFDSTIAGDKTRDLNVGKRSAMQGLLETLGIKRAETGAADMRAALAQAMGFDQTLSAESMANADRSQSAALANANMALQSRGLDQNDADRVLREMFGKEDINLRREGMASDNTNRTLDRNQQAAQFLKSFGLDAEKFGYGKTRDAAEDSWRRDQFDYSKGRDAAGDAFRDKSFDWQKGQDLWGRDFSTNNAMMQFMQMLAGQQFLPDGGGSGGSAPSAPSGTTGYPAAGGGGYPTGVNGGPMNWDQLLAQFQF